MSEDRFSSNGRDDGWLFRERVSLSVGLLLRQGLLGIREHEVAFEPATGDPLSVSGPYTVDKHMLAPRVVKWDVALGHDDRTREPVLLTVNGRRAKRVIAALRAAGFEVSVRRTI